MIKDYSEITATLNNKRILLNDQLEQKKWCKALETIKELISDFDKLNNVVFNQMRSNKNA